MSLNKEILSKLAREARIRDNLHLRDILDQRGIKSLYHFTQYTNLQSIRMNGLRSRSKLRGISHQISDSARFDEIDYGTSLSVSLPNIFMLKKKMASTKARDFIVLEYDSKLLLDLDFVAFPGNASSTSVKEWRKINISACLGAEGFERMFMNNEIRARENLHSSITTDPQAEIMALEDVSWEKYVKRIYFHETFSKDALDKIEIMREAGYIPATKNVTTLQPSVFLNPFDQYSEENQRRYDTKFSLSWMEL